MGSIDEGQKIVKKMQEDWEKESAPFLEAMRTEFNWDIKVEKWEEDWTVRILPVFRINGKKVVVGSNHMPWINSEYNTTIYVQTVMGRIHGWLTHKLNISQRYSRLASIKGRLTQTIYDVEKERLWSIPYLKELKSSYSYRTGTESDKIFDPVDKMERLLSPSLAENCERFREDVLINSRLLFNDE